MPTAANMASTQIGGAAASAVIGAAAGNPPAGAAIGAGRGRLLGGTTGLSAVGYSGVSLHSRYDMGDPQSMTAMGDNVPATAAGLWLLATIHTLRGTIPITALIRTRTCIPIPIFVHHGGNHRGHVGGPHHVMAHR